jgi:protein involved in sex pheromone biosynthesis
MNITKQILVFAMAWMGTRDIYTALILTAVFTVLSDHLFNEESPYCVVPAKFRILSKIIDTNEDGLVSEQEINEAISILDKAKREKDMKNKKHSFTLFHNYLQDSYTNMN